MSKIVLATFQYCDPRTGRQFTVQEGWPCASNADAEQIVKYWGMKTGALSAQCKLEEYTDEEIQQCKTETTTTEANQA